LFVGQLESRKAPLLAAGAAIRAHAAGAQFVLAVVGGGPLEAALGSLQGDAVRVLGHRSDVQRLLSAADVFVQPSEREGMSFALLEAMSHGLCIVASDSSSNPEALGGCGVLFPSGDEQALTAALIRLTADSVRRVALGALARDRASSHFSPEGFLAGTKTIYEQALANVTAPGRGAVGALA
jgi:glycosyltransferase involved in cell wall biosynthesis